MGAEPWHYFVPYQNDIGRALSELRQKEFEAGRYNPVQPFPCFPPGPETPDPGAHHASIEDAVWAGEADGTRSILDMNRVGCDPDDSDLGVVSPVAEETLQVLFETIQPTRAMVEGGLEVMQTVERGHGIYIFVYRDGSPAEIFFAGYSYD